MGKDHAIFLSFTPCPLSGYQIFSMDVDFEALAFTAMAPSLNFCSQKLQISHLISLRSFRPKSFLHLLSFTLALLSVVESDGALVRGQTAGFLRLQRAYTHMKGLNREMGISQEQLEILKAHDKARRLRILSTVIDFPVGGTADPYIAGLYFTRISLGTPSKEYFVQVDTGSDILWLNCSPCISCPTSSNLGIPLLLYNPEMSSTSSLVGCTDPVCETAHKIADTSCLNQQNCGYAFQYGDGSTTIGYLVADRLLYNTILSGSTVTHAEAKIVFGCAFNQTGELLTSDRAVDGIMGFGQSDLSVISQLSSQGRAPRIFAHCLQGADSGGGVLVLGNVLEPGIVYTPIVPSQPHYNVELKYISVNGAPLNVDASSYSTSNVQGTIFDSGTTLTYLTESAFGPFVNAIIERAPTQARVISPNGNACFLYSGSVDEDFPIVTFHFEGADMNLKGTNYLMQHASIDDDPVWCIGWQSSGAGAANNGMQMTILGDMVLKDKIVVYDLENQQVGWVNYDCSSSISVSTVTGVSQSVLPHRIGNSAVNGRTKQFSWILFAIFVTNCWVV